MTFNSLEINFGFFEVNEVHLTVDVIGGKKVAWSEEKSRKSSPLPVFLNHFIVGHCSLVINNIIDRNTFYYVIQTGLFMQSLAKKEAGF